MVNALSSKAMLVTLHVSVWAARKNENAITDEVLRDKNAAKGAGNFTKRLLDSKATASIWTIIRQMKAYHWDHTQPWLNDGTRILPSALYPDYSKTMRKLKADLEQAIAGFIKEYPKFIQQAKKDRLGTMFNADDYPSASELKGRFGATVDYLPIPESDDFRISLDPTAMGEIKRDLEKKVNQQLEVALQDVGERIAKVVRHMATKLKEYKPADKRKGNKAESSFRDSLVSNVLDIAGLIPAFNIIGNKKLATLHKRIMAELEIDPDALREDTDLRKKTVLSAESILAQIEEFMK